ncbi:MAG: hypothetical protein AB7S65_00355 [Sulfuricurvum sp.]
MVNYNTVMRFRIQKVLKVLLLIDVIVFGSGALYALLMNTYGG